MERKHVCILPSTVPLEANAASPSSSRFLRLPHPRTHQPALFLPYSKTCPPSGSPDALLEVQRISLDADKQRCWFIDQEVVSDGSIAMFTPFDPLFLAISYLSTLPPHFISYADIWDSIAQKTFEVDASGASEDDAGQFVEDLTRLGQLELVRARLLTLCDSQNDSDGAQLLRYSAVKALALLRAKVDALAAIEDGIFGPLAATEPGEERKPDVDAAAHAAGGAPAYTTVTRGLGKEDVGSGHGLSAEIQTESRQKYAIEVIVNYLPPAVAKELRAAYDFPALKAYLSLVTPNSVVLNTTYLPGRGSAKLEGGGSADDLGGGSAAKKRKLEQSKGSRGVEALKKVNTKGMKSLAELFGKQTAKGTSVPASAGAKAAAAQTDKPPAAKKKKTSK